MNNFSTLDNSQNIPFGGSNVSGDGLGLTNPDAILSGTTRGITNLGGANIYSDAGAGQIVVQPNGIPQVLMGNQQTFGEGFYVAKAGINAITNTDASQWIFNSNQNVFKIAQKTRVLNSTANSFTCPGNQVATFTQIDTYNHGLSFAPYPLGSVQDPGSNSGFDPTTNVQFSAISTTQSLTVTWFVYSDSVHLYTAVSVLCDSTANAGGAIVTILSYPFIAYLLQETAN